MTQPLLTIMLPTTIDRRRRFYVLLHELLGQINKLAIGEEIEIIIDEDNKQKSIGKKRQDILEKANGIWVVGIDSDDFIHPEYVYDIYMSLKSNPQIDHVGFLEDCNIDGVNSLSIFSIKHQQWAENTDGYDHICCANPKSVIRRTKALQVGYQDIRFGEDRIFSEAVTPLLVSEVFIDKPLYRYIHISSPHNERYGFDKD